MKTDLKKIFATKEGSAQALKKLHLEKANPVYMIAAGLVFLTILVGMFYFGGNSQNDNEAILERAKQTLSQFSAGIQSLQRAMEDKQVKELASIALADESKLPNLQNYLAGRIPDLLEVQIYGPDLSSLRGDRIQPYGYAVLDMLMKANNESAAPIQMHGSGDQAYVAMARRIGQPDEVEGFVFLKIKSTAIINEFNSALPGAGSFALDQYNGRFTANSIVALSAPPSESERVMWLRIPGALFRLGVVQSNQMSGNLDILRPLFFIGGVTLLILGIMLKLRPYKLPDEDEEEAIKQAESDKSLSASKPRTGKPIINDLPDLGITLENPNLMQFKATAPVELLESIFRAYDIRGVVGETLDAEVAYQVGQVVGSLTREQDAGPVMVGRDGRDSGPALVKGMIDGITSTGCDVINVGAVPTGVLYYSAYELGKGTGVMITGSHNPPDYNGFKMLIGGVTQAGDQITDIYRRIKKNEVMVGKGNVTNEDVVERYRERISSDIQLARPLRVVADCGNGIGGVCAADVLRDIGAVVMPLFDEVDGNFPNHHPDPSDPHNLVDLISSVQVLEADIGVAFDGDADRLGVVTADGEIIYSDRLMMLFAEDVLSREPDSTIIYDVKCTGHLQHIIADAGGKPMMYKTGHSLIKNKMKEVDAPFAGEMSGHFFFKERWYGFDCGIYAAARLLEILAKDSRTPTEVLSSLPNSVSTPELKVEMQEGENHAFVTAFQKVARFEGAQINTIDGVRADFPDGWGLVRASNTTPILVCRFDADTEEALDRISHAFKRQMLELNPELSLPF
jgi:phosphomannomutase/phosphoglucomutase